MPSRTTGGGEPIVQGDVDKWLKTGHEPYIHMKDWLIKREELKIKGDKLGLDYNSRNPGIWDAIREIDDFVRMRGDICMSCGTVNRLFFKIEEGNHIIHNVEEKIARLEEKKEK